jgi:hypothetical protein
MISNTVMLLNQNGFVISVNIFVVAKNAFVGPSIGTPYAV